MIEKILAHLGLDPQPPPKGRRVAGMQCDFQKGLKVHGVRGRRGYPLAEQISSAGGASRLTLHFWRVGHY